MVRRYLPLIIVALCTAAVVQTDTQRLTTGPSLQPEPADVLFDDEVLHDIRLVINSRDWEFLKAHYMEDTYYPCNFYWGNLVVRNVGIRSRGTGSRSGVKPGLRVDFDRYATAQTFLGLKSVVLRNNTQDASNLHERLSMLLFQRMSLPAPREAHIRLFVNNEYVGLYTIVESVDKAFLKRTFGEDAGYLFKYDYPGDAQPYRFEYRGSDPGLYVPLPFKPETHEADPRPEFIEQLVWTINETNDAVFRTAIAEYLDLRQFVRYLAVENFLADIDGFLGNWGMNNFYFYRFDTQKRFTFIAWDKSEAFKGGIEYAIWRNISGVPSGLQNRLVMRTFAHADLVDLYVETLLGCARSAGERQVDSLDERGWLERELLKEYNQVREAALADPVKPYTNDEFTHAVEDLLAFAQKRGEFVVQEVSLARAQWRLVAGR